MNGDVCVPKTFFRKESLIKETGLFLRSNSIHLSVFNIPLLEDVYTYTDIAIKLTIIIR